MLVRTLLPLILALTCAVSAPGRANDIGQGARPAATFADDVSVAVHRTTQVAVAEDMAVGPAAAPTSPTTPQPARALPSIQIQR